MIRDVVVAGMAGFVATKLMEPVSTKLYELESPRARAQEERVRPGPPYRIAARKVTEMVGLDLDECQLDAAGMAAHYGLGMSWAWPTLSCATAGWGRSARRSRPERPYRLSSTKG